MKKKIRRILLIVLFAALVLVFLYSAYQLAGIAHSYSESATYFKQVRKEYVKPREEDPAVTRSPESTEAPVEIRETSPIDVDFDALLEMNPDVRAWLYAPDTKIDYPIVQAKDNDYYLHRMMDKSYNPGGTLFIDYRCAGDFSSKNTLIYGHHMGDGSMLASIVDYKTQEYFDKHPVMYLNTPNGNYRLDIVAGFVTYYDSRVYNYEFDSRTEFEEWFALMRGFSDFESRVKVDSDDLLVTLSTCTYEYDNARYVVLAKLVPIT